MNRIKCVIAIILCSFYFVSRGQTSVSWETNLKKAVEKAKSENKLVFVNFVAEGLAPSVQFARQIGESQELAQYFESRFVSVLVDISKDQQVARQFQIQGLPTLLFLDSRGKEIKRLLGGVTPEHIIYWAQVLTGEKPSVDMLWEQYRQDKDNLALMGQILREMPIYSLGLTCRADAEKWQDRVEKLFQTYWNAKPREEMINEKDFGIIVLYCQKWEEKNDPVEFVIKHYEEYAKIIPAQMLISYLASYVNTLVNNLAMAGDLEYKQVLARLQGDLKPIFDVVQTKSLPVEYLMTAKADALYTLFREKDQEKYIQLQRDYLEKMGDLAGKEDYQNAAMNLLVKMQNKLTRESATQALLWLDKLISFPMEVSEKAVFVASMGDCYLTLENKQKAKECFNQAFMMSLQSQDPQLQAYFQQKVAALSDEE